MTGRAGEAVIDWTKIETRYVAGDKSLKDLAKEFRVSYSTLSKHAADEKWVEKRRVHRAAVEKEALTRAQARAQKRMDELLKASEKLMDAAVEAVKDNDQFKRWVNIEGSGDGCSEAVEKVFDKRDTRAMKDMVFVLEKLTGILRDAYGIRTPEQQLGEKLAKERISQVRAQTQKLRRENGDGGKETGGALILPVIDEVERDEDAD